MTTVIGQTAAAGELLESACAAADRLGDSESLPRIGLFGLGVPEGLVAAAGSVCIHVNFGASPDNEPMRDVIEPFVDHEVRVFLNRFALGDFNGLAGVVFARDDAAALTAYQYATEWVRQGRAPVGTPPLFLFNLVHSRTVAAQKFNRIQCDKLVNFLVRVGLDRPGDAAMSAMAALSRRRDGLLQAARAVPGALTTQWRNAGRFMSVAAHTELLERAVADFDRAERAGPRLGLVGSAVDDPGFLAMLDRVGVLVADLQAYGQFWPGAWEQKADIEAMLDVLSGDPSCPRIVPPQNHRQSLVDRVVAAECDLVVCQLAQTDDTFGWELPALKAALAAHGIRFVHLGFRDHRPDADWLAGAEQKLVQALEAAP
ncbi:hypothetical protein NIM87_01155 [Devosia sp. XJ19-1]|uniref:2-hydroxyacyl-CoA dehydratase n=1 Tax=Devosia ureilytica TaxID=2952754 RepID=A0A9Q4ALR0_9HYPH|nr:2-hydroxyacyl-CoA dehydratase family protein [Devosia ureilytica]MCP8882104.1 hypothetical protein [Devosia ureilytica]MCP8886010.1 hypothetical protein [Devosia ureilytica]